MYKGTIIVDAGDATSGAVHGSAAKAVVLQWEMVLQ